MLKNSARNCTLKFSEMRRMRLFLNTETSNLDTPGPIIALRPKFPHMFAPGKPKHSVWLYRLGFPGLLSVPQFGPARRFGRSLVSSNFMPAGSPPRIGVKGWPELALYM